MHSKNSELPKYEQYVNALVKSFAKEIEEELGFYCEGDGGRMPRDVEEIEVWFAANRRATIEEARQIEVYTTEKLLRAINADEKLRPFLREYPFTPSRVSIRISFNNAFNEQFTDGTITFMSIIKGNIHYRTMDPIHEKYEHILVEPYQGALKIVQSKPLNLEDLRRHQPSPYEDYVDQLFANFAKEVKKKWGLYCFAVGGKLVNGIEEMAMRFVIDKRTPIEKARELQVSITERLREIINADPVLRPHLKEYPFPANRTRICIHFQKRDYSYFTDGTVAIVYPENDKLLYFTEKPEIDGVFSCRPVPLAEESYEEAKKLIQKASDASKKTSL